MKCVMLWSGMGHVWGAQSRDRMVKVHQECLARVISANNATSGIVMVNFMCQPDGPQVPRHLIKHYSGLSVRYIYIFNEISM